MRDKCGANYGDLPYCVFCWPQCLSLVYLAAFGAFGGHEVARRSVAVLCGR